MPANPVNDRRIANAVTKDGSTVRYVQNLRTTYLEPYRTNVPYPYHYKKSVPYQRTFLGPHFGGSPGGWYPQIMSKYFSLKYLLISKKTGTLGYMVKKLAFGGSIWGVPGGVVPPNYVKIFLS